MTDTLSLDPRKRPRQKRSKATVDALIEATARVLVEEGPDAATTNRIAKAAGVSVGSLYQYFPNKEALVIAVARRHTERMLNMLLRYATDLADAPVEQAVRTYVHAMFEAHHLEPELHRALLPSLVRMGVEQFGDFQLRTLAVIRAWLERHREAIQPDNLDAAASVLLLAVESTTHGTFLDDLAAVGPEAMEAEVTALVLRYLLGEVPG